MIMFGINVNDDENSEIVHSAAGESGNRIDVDGGFANDCVGALLIFGSNALNPVKNNHHTLWCLFELYCLYCSVSCCFFCCCCCCCCFEKMEMNSAFLEFGVNGPRIFKSVGCTQDIFFHNANKN